MKFYGKNGNELIGIDEFISTYRSGYFLEGEQVVKEVNRSSRFVEDKINTILEKESWTSEDVILILAWKIGKIKHAQSRDAREFVFAKGWENAVSDCKVLLRKVGEVSLKDFANYICEKKEILKDEALQSKDGAQKVLNKLSKVAPSGIGTVYLITLLFFISGGIYPIYDRFARIALTAILDEKKPGDKIVPKDLPDNSSVFDFNGLMKNELKTYIDDLEKVFGTDYQTDRSIDQALWVYGHRFDGKNGIGCKKSCR